MRGPMFSTGGSTFPHDACGKSWEGGQKSLNKSRVDYLIPWVSEVAVSLSSNKKKVKETQEESIREETKGKKRVEWMPP